MENVSKALLIAASVLIVILIVTLGIKLLNSTGETTQQAQQVGDSISSASKDAVDKIVQVDKNTPTTVTTYKINVECTGCEPDQNNPTVIKQNETVTLKFNSIAGTAMVNWGYSVEGANIINVAGHQSLMLSFTLENPTKDVELKVEAVGCCFVAGTQVLMADKTTKSIEDVKVGDVVLSYNELTNEYENKTVTKLIVNPNTTNLARVNLVDGTSIEMNEYHPIYTEEGWKSLTNHEGLPTLSKEDKVLSVDRKFIQISSIECWQEKAPITTYNLSVEDNHNYFVGEKPVLVHNADCPT